MHITVPRSRPAALRVVLAALAVCVAPAFAEVPAAVADGKPLTLPAKLDAGLFYLHPRTRDGTELRLYSDTGGGLFFTGSGSAKLGVAVDAKATADHPQRVPWPEFDARAWIPQPGGTQRGMPVMPKPSPPAAPVIDGLLGGAWFGGRSWQFDYPRGQLRLLANGSLPRVPVAHQVRLGFQKGQDGQPTTHFPRIPVRIDGETLQLLFDTGATLRLSPEAARELDQGPTHRAGSFITATVLERWRERHPHWRVIENADAYGKLRIIEVPSLELGGYEVGPVWFAERRDQDLHDYMSQWMDQRVDGAIGGNAMRTLRISVDYPAGLAVFER